MRLASGAGKRKNPAELYFPLWLVLPRLKQARSSHLAGQCIGNVDNVVVVAAYRVLGIRAGGNVRNTVAHLETRDAGTCFLYPAHDLVSRHHGQPGQDEFALGYMQVRMAHAAR